MRDDWSSSFSSLSLLLFFTRRRKVLCGDHLVMSFEMTDVIFSLLSSSTDDPKNDDVVT